MSEENKIVVDDLLIQRLKDNVINRKLKIDFQRTDILLDVYKKYEGYPQIIIRARFLEALLERKKIYIDDSLFVGSLAGEFGAFYIYPEWDTHWLEEERDKFDIPEQENKKLDEVLAYWKERSLPNRAGKKFSKLYNEKFEDYFDSGFIHNGTLSPDGVSASNYEKIINVGLESVIKDIEDRQAKLEFSNENKEKFDFYEAALIELRAVIDYAKRYERLAYELAEKEDDERRKQHYLAIAEVIGEVPAKPAKTFRQALQSHLFLHIIAELEQVGCGYSHGYLGQALEPFYQLDKAKGNITEREALYLIKHHFLKLNDISYYYGKAYDLANSGDTAQTISLGGYNEKGEDATGEVDYLILDAQLDLRLPQPPLALVYHSKLKPEFVQKAIELIKTGIGMPQFMNGDVLVARSLDAYSRYGATVEEARRTSVNGCVSTAIQHKTTYLMGDTLNIAKAFELALYNGKDPLTNIQVGEKTGEAEDFKSFEEFYNAFLIQLEKGVQAARRHGKIKNSLVGEFLQVPYRSVLTDGCVESGKDIWHDGGKYTATATTYCGGVDAGNSLIVIKNLVYDNKKVTIKELKKALEADFEGYEVIEGLCNGVLKHGNNVDEDEAIIRRVYDDAFNAFQKEGLNFFGKYGKPDAYSKSFHNYFGLLTGALPTGRKARKALTDGSVSAQPGTDQNGPLALVISAAKAMDTIKYNSVHFNVKLNPEQLKSPTGNAALIALIEGFIKNGGNHIQFNCIDAEVLKDAKLHPERHKDLVVRVAGFSAFFTKLHQGVQDEIIARTEHSLAV